jgi:hypothetical protein
VTYPRWHILFGNRLLHYWWHERII